MQNAGTRFQKNFADEMLLERLRILPTDDMVDISVRNRCNQLYRGWAITYKDTQGMQSIANLHRQLPKKRQQVDQNRYKVIRDTEREAQENPFGTEEELEPPAPATPPPGSRRTSVSGSTSSPGQSSSFSPRSAASSHARTTSTSKSTADPEYAAGGIWGYHSRKSSKSKPSKHGKSASGSGQQVFDLAKEKNNMLSAIANSSIASTNLLNAMRHLDREKLRVSEDADCLKRFETCKALRRQILRYIQLVESEQWIGSLLNANDELVKALIAFEINDKSVDEDSDSEGETEMYNDPTKGGLVLRGREEEGVQFPASSGARAPSTEGTGTQSRRTSVHRPAPPVPTSAPPSRRSSLAAGGQSNLANDFNNMNFGGGAEAAPPKPPRPGHLPPVVQHLNESRGHHQAGQKDAIPPTPITEGNEDDPFGDQNAF